MKAPCPVIAIVVPATIAMLALAGSAGAALPASAASPDGAAPSQTASPVDAGARRGEGNASDTSSFTDPVTAHFAPYSADSPARMAHDEWSGFLRDTIVYAGYSKHRLGRGTKRTWAGSRMRFGNALPSRYENNRVMLSAFTDEHRSFLTNYRAAMEAAPDRLPLAQLNRAEQLAYWLNLYNVHALELLTARYPTETVEALRSPPDAPPAGVWYELTLEVDGVALSLHDIETRILFPIWRSPLVLYGLWQGAIGGPRLPMQAYEGSRVWRMLEENADEFVNSNRAMRPRGQTLHLSQMYGWGEALFSDDQALLAHLRRYARPPFSEGLDVIETLDIDLYDAHLADLSGGTLHRGDWNTNAALIGGLQGTGSGPNLMITQAMRSDASRRRLPPQTLELLRSMDRYNERERSPVVTVEECAEGDDCPGDADGASQAPR